MNDTFSAAFGQAKYLIKQHDTGVFARRFATRLAAPNCFVKMPRTDPARARERSTPRRAQHHARHTDTLARHVTITKSLRRSGSTTRRIQLATRKELSDFLASVERRAFKQALFAVRDEQAALDIVQDAMMKLSEKYATRPAEEMPMLFQRILQNTIRDYYRRQKVRRLWTTQVSTLASAEDGDEHDPLETLEVNSDSNPQEGPSEQLQQSQMLEIIEKALQVLPKRQRQAFLLRYWEEMDVAEAAAIMGCSEGSVKTHCSRATHALAALLKEKGISL